MPFNARDMRTMTLRTEELISPQAGQGEVAKERG
jgi:hypothetical protein